MRKVSGPKRALILSFTADVGPDGGLTSEDYDLYRWAGNALGQCVKGVDLGN